MERMLCVASLLAGQIVLPATAADGDYRCRIVDVRSVEPDGSLETTRFWLDVAKHSPLVIDRVSGVVVHPMLDNSLGDNQVLDVGSSEHSFKLLSRFGLHGGFPGVNYYEVDEYDEGPEKSLRVMAHNYVFSGICR